LNKSEFKPGTYIKKQGPEAKGYNATGIKLKFKNPQQKTTV